jgi:hypothetical protein
MTHNDSNARLPDLAWGNAQQAAGSRQLAVKDN